MQVRQLPPRWTSRVRFRRYGQHQVHGGSDNALMLTDDGLDWRVRDDFLDEACDGTTLYTKWLPWPDVEVQT